MVAKQQEIRDPGSKHPGNELSEYEDKIVLRNFALAVVLMVLFFALLMVLGATNLLH